MKSYNFTRCENPRLFKNKFTGELLQIRCGVCKACAIERSTRMTALCQEEERMHKYTLFTTLTYNDDHIPLLQPIYSKRMQGYRLYNLCHRLKDLGSLVYFEPDCYHKSSDWMQSLLSKCQLDGKISYASKREAQLFLKRLRKYLSRFTYEKIRYYIVSEYGPVHFRAHYHVLFFYNEEITNHYIKRCIRWAWSSRQKVKVIQKGKTKTLYKIKPFGYIYNTLSRGKSSSYVARYVNSSVNIPRFYSFAKFPKPFALHSKFFAFSLSQSEKEEIYKSSDFTFVDRFVQQDDRLIPSELFDSFKARLFPRCRDFNHKSIGELLQSYKIYRTASVYYGTSSISVQASLIYDDLRLLKDNKVTNYFKFIKLCPDYQQLHLDPDVDARYFCLSRIKSDLYLSKHFYEYCCDSDKTKEYHRVVQIRDFWKFISLRRLRNFYLEQEYFINAYFSNLDYLPFMYVNFSEYFFKHIDDFRSESSVIYDNFEDFCIHQINKIFSVDGTLNYGFKPDAKQHYFHQILSDDISTRFEKSIKHKRLNDANNLLLKKINTYG